MPYSAEISRDNRTAFLFVIDQSGSMDERPEGGRMKSEFVADVLNKASPGIADMLGASLIAGFLATTAAVVVGFYSAVATHRFGLDPLRNALGTRLRLGECYLVRLPEARSAASVRVAASQVPSGEAGRAREPAMRGPSE